MSKTIVVTSMYANPIHPGHIECLFLAKELGDELWVIVNNDKQAELKRGMPSFQDEQFRMSVVGALKPVDKTILSIDSTASVVETLEQTFNVIKHNFNDAIIIFAKGGDRFATEIPEGPVCAKYGVKIVDGLGKKTHNSSDFIKELKQ